MQIALPHSICICLNPNKKTLCFILLAIIFELKIRLERQERLTAITAVVPLIGDIRGSTKDFQINGDRELGGV